MKLSQALEATIRHVLPLPNHVLAVHFLIPPLDGEHGDGADEEDEFRLVSLAGIPGMQGLIGHWSLVREVQIVHGGRGLAWPSGERVTATMLLLAPISAPLHGDQILALTAPVRRPRRAHMH